MSAHDLKQSLGVKGYLLDHYISMCFNLIAKIDFVGLQDDIYDAMAKFMDSISDYETKIEFDCQEVHTKQILCLLSKADYFLKQALHDFIHEKTFECGSYVDIIELRQTEEILTEIIGLEKMSYFQMLFINCFLSCSIFKLFLLGLTTELTRRFITRDIETDTEIFRLYLNKFWTQKTAKT